MERENSLPSSEEENEEILQPEEEEESGGGGPGETAGFNFNSNNERGIDDVQSDTSVSPQLFRILNIVLI